MNIEKATSKIETLLQKRIARRKDLHNAVLSVHSDKLGIHIELGAGTVTRENTPTPPGTPFHIASIGKLFMSVVMGILYEGGRIDYRDPVKQYLPPGILEGLHVYRGRDYSGDILVKNLLNHTSGIADYFTGKPESGQTILENAVSEPGRFWSPQETIQWAKDNLHARFPPGKGFHYSDTGYQLLGLIVEKITGKTYGEVLQEFIFDKLGMNHSYLLFYTEPREKSPYPLAEIYLDEDEVSGNSSLSVDWGGGGIVSTTGDLLLFHKALVENTLLKAETFDKFKDWARFSPGIDYGYGLVRIDFKKMLFIFPRRLNMWGNFGSIATFMFYIPALDTYISGTFNQSNYVKKQVGFLVKILNILAKL